MVNLPPLLNDAGGGVDCYAALSQNSYDKPVRSVEARGGDGVYVAITQLSFPHIAGAHLFSPPTPQTNSQEVTVCGDRS